MAKKAESRLQRRIRDALEKLHPNAFWWKCHGGPFQKAGLPDLIGCVSGMFIAGEVKVPGGKTSEIQDETIKDLLRAGARVFVWESVKEAVRDVGMAVVEASSAASSGLCMRETIVRSRVSAAARKDVDRLRRPRKKKA